MDEVVFLIIIMPVLVIVLTIIGSLRMFFESWERDRLEKKLKKFMED